MKSLIYGHHGAFCTEKQLEFEPAWKSTEVLMVSNYGALHQWINEKSQLFDFSFTSDLNEEHIEKLLTNADRWPAARVMDIELKLWWIRVGILTANR